MKKVLVYALMALVIAGCKKGKCDDGEQNGDETGIDCGGDCAICETCSDGIKNQDEVDVDCGGVCEPCAIQYPATGTYGTNLLTLEDTIYVAPSEYSLRAVIPAGSTLKLKLNSVSGGTWGWQPSTNVGWSQGEMNGGEQFYEALNETCEIKLDLSPINPGMFQVWYYENSESVTRVGYVYVD